MQVNQEANIKLPPGGNNGTSINDFKLIPQSVNATGTGGGWSDPLQPFAVVEVQLNKINRALYGAGGSVPVRFVTPTHLGNEGKWFGIQKMGNVPVYLPYGTGVVPNPLDPIDGYPVLTNDDGINPIVYYQATNEGWQLQSSNVNLSRFVTKAYVDTQVSQIYDADIPQRTFVNIAPLTKTGLTGGATLTGTIVVNQTAHFATMDLNFGLNIGTNALGDISVKIPNNLLPEANVTSIDFPILAKIHGDDITDSLHLQKYQDYLILIIGSSFLKTKTNKSIWIAGTLAYFKKQIYP